MTKSEVKREFLAWTEGRPFISLPEICKAMHIGRDRARSIVSGLNYFSSGRRKDFLVDDVARRIAEEAKTLGGDRSRAIEIPEEVVDVIEKPENTKGACDE